MLTRSCDRNNMKFMEDVMRSFLDERDLEVVPILLDLCNPVVFEQEPRTPPMSLIWDSKKRRTRRIISKRSSGWNLFFKSDSPVSPLNLSSIQFNSNSTKSKKTSRKRKRVETPQIKDENRMPVSRYDGPVENLPVNDQPEAPIPLMTNQQPSVTIQIKKSVTVTKRGFDLNLPPLPDVDDFQPSDLDSASASKKARRRRMERLRAKKKSRSRR